MNSRHLKILFALLLLVGITALSFYPALGNGFTNWDDPIHVLENNFIKELSPANLKHIFSAYIGENYYPFTILSYALEYHFVQLNPKVYHTTNLVLHLANVLLVYWLIFLLTKRQAAAWIVTLLFGIHPLQVEPVAWISSRKDVLFAFFYLGALVSYVFHLTRHRPQGRFFGLSLILFVCSFLSKPVAASFPFLLLAFDYYLERKWEKRVFMEKIPFFVITLIFGVVAYFAQIVTGTYETTTYSWLERFLFVTYGLVMPLFKFMAPYPLSSFYPYPDKVNNVMPFIYNISPFIVACVAYAVYKTARWTRDIMFGALFFLITIFCVLRFYPVGGFITADRYTYLPYIGIAFIVVRGLGYLADGKARWAGCFKPVIFVLVAGCLGGLSFLTWHRCGVWKNSLTLWNDVVEQYPNLVIANQYRGRARYDRGEFDLAIADFNKALWLKPDYAKGYNGRGKAYSKNYRSDLAIADFNKAIEFDPDYAQAYVNRGGQYVFDGKYELGLKDLNRAQEIDPDIPEIYANRGRMYAETDAYEPAIREFTKALEINPFFLKAYSYRGKVYLKSKRYDEAIDDYSKALSFNRKEDDPDDYYYRGTAYALKRRYDPAIADLEKAIALDPEYLEAYYNRGSVYKNKGEYDAAIVDYTKALSLDPDYARAYLKRAEAYEAKKEFTKALDDALRARSLGMKVDKNFIEKLQSLAHGQR